MPPFLYLVTFSRENNTKFCLRIDRDFIPEFRNRDVDFFTSFKELNGSLKTNILLSRFLRLQKYGKCYSITRGPVLYYDTLSASFIMTYWPTGNASQILPTLL